MDYPLLATTSTLSTPSSSNSSSPDEFLFETCVDCVESAIAAEQGGAKRLEVCDSLIEGGITPSYGKLKQILRSVHIPIHVLIRPRGGDFVYSEHDMQIMMEDIRLCKELGVQGIVIGVLKANGEIDTEQTKRLITIAMEPTHSSSTFSPSSSSPLSITFHRAIDTTPDPLAAFKTCMELGIDRVLTSGAAANALEGASIIEQMVDLCSTTAVSSSSFHKTTKVIAGGGVTPHNIRQIIELTNVREIHGTARVTLPGRNQYRPTDDKLIVYMGGERKNIPETEFTTKQSTVDSVQTFVRLMY